MEEPLAIALLPDVQPPPPPAIPGLLAAGDYQTAINSLKAAVKRAIDGEEDVSLRDLSAWLTYRRCADVLKRELGEEPMPETRDGPAHSGGRGRLKVHRQYPGGMMTTIMRRLWFYTLVGMGVIGALAFGALADVLVWFVFAHILHTTNTPWYGPVLMIAFMIGTRLGTRLLRMLERTFRLP